MKQYEIAANVGKEVFCTRGRDLYFEVGLRPVLNQKALLIKQARSGMLYLRHEGKHYSIPMSAVKTLPNNDEEVITRRLTTTDIKNQPYVREEKLCAEEAFRRFMWDEIYNWGDGYNVSIVGNKIVSTRKMADETDIVEFFGSDSDLFPLWKAVNIWDFVKLVHAEYSPVPAIVPFGRGAFYNTPEHLVPHVGPVMYIGKSLLQAVCMAFFGNMTHEDRAWMIDVEIEKLLYLTKRHLFFGDSLEILKTY